jgi:hypothetical protein
MKKTDMSCLDLSYSQHNFKFPSISVDEVNDRSSRLRTCFKLNIDYKISMLRPKVFMFEER